MTKILDITKTIKAANGNISLAKELFTMLLNDLEEKEEQLNLFLIDHDLENLEELAHKLFGATAYCVTPELRMAAQNLEQSLKTDSLRSEQLGSDQLSPAPLKPVQLTELQHLVNHLQKAINEVLNEGPTILNMDWETN